MFKLMHMTRTISDLDVLYMHGKIRRLSFQYNMSHVQLKLESLAIIKTKLFSSTPSNEIFSFHKMSSLAPRIPTTTT
jgi:hypothetical protein